MSFDPRLGGHGGPVVKPIQTQKHDLATLDISLHEIEILYLHVFQ